MKVSNIIIFILVIVIVLGIIGYAVWNSGNNISGDNILSYQINETNDTLNITDSNVNEETGNLIITNTTENQTSNNDINNYVGDWYISEETYMNAERIDEIMDQKEDNLITEQEFQEQMKSEINKDIAELDVEYYRNGQIRFDFTLTSPAPTQREGKLDDIVVNMEENVGTFTYTDNWGTSGNGTITLEDNKITLKLETTKASQGALWGVEGIYTFSYKRID